MFEQIDDFQAEYRIGDYTVGADGIVQQWRQRSVAFREAHPPLPWTVPKDSQVQADLFRCGSATSSISRGLVVFIHGGYWVQFNRADFSHLAQGALALGWDVAMLGYPLAPEADISRIVAVISRAIEALSTTFQGPMRLVGHSAGGHLASMQAVQGQLSPGVWRRVEHIVSLSGVHDLRPLPAERLDPIDPSRIHVETYSPVLQRPAAGTRLTCWLGSEERPEFIRQSRMMADMWLGLGAATRLEIVRGKNHFDIINDLAAPESALTRCLLQPIP